MNENKLLLGFVGQGFVGKNYADHFEDRGFSVIRYSLEDQFRMNRDRIRDCDVVFIAVPTPSTPDGFDDSRISEAISLVGVGKIAVIKSTVVGGTTEKMQAMFPGVIVVHNPEFLRESFARQDVDNPNKVYVGIVNTESQAHRDAADVVMGMMPDAPLKRVLSARDAEFLKYTHNTMGYATILFSNMLFDLAVSHGVAWDCVEESLLKNPWFPEKYIKPLHGGGRGAGGACFIKDFAAFTESYGNLLSHDKEGLELLRAMSKKNNRLLLDSGKSIEILRMVYGDDVVRSSADLS